MKIETPIALTRCSPSQAQHAVIKSSEEYVALGIGEQEPSSAEDERVYDVFAVLGQGILEKLKWVSLFLYRSKGVRAPIRFAHRNLFAWFLKERS